MKTNRMTQLLMFLPVLFVISVLAVPRAIAQPETFTIAAANSLKDALRKVLPAFESQHPEVMTAIRPACLIRVETRDVATRM